MAHLADSAFQDQDRINEALAAFISNISSDIITCQNHLFQQVLTVWNGRSQSRDSFSMEAGILIKQLLKPKFRFDKNNGKKSFPNVNPAKCRQRQVEPNDLRNLLYVFLFRKHRSSF